MILFSRKTKTWLPAVVNQGGGTYTYPDDIRKSTPTLYADRNPYTEDIYDSSSHEKKLQHYGPGEKWRPKQSAQRVAYLMNNSTDSLYCPQFKVLKNEISYTLVKDTDFASGQLTVVRTLGESGELSYEFTDANGQTLLVRTVDKTQTTSPVFYDTYYVYDIYGNLCYVLPPAMTAAMNPSDASQMSTLLQKYGYCYIYDAYNCCIAKQTPGSGWTYYAYDNVKRVYLCQPENLRAKNQWYLMNYDAMGRIIAKTIMTPRNKFTLQSIYDHSLNSDDNTVFREQFMKNPVSVKYPEYHRYGNGVQNLLPFQDVQGVVNWAECTSDNTGLKRHVQLPVYTQDAVKYVNRTYYYDREARLIQTVEQNHLGGINRKSVKYNYIGSPVIVDEQIQPGSGVKVDTKRTTYEYDHANRLVSETAILNGQDTTSISY